MIGELTKYDKLNRNKAIQVDEKHYEFSSYDSLNRFISYYHQIKEILNLNPNRVLEIGPGNKTVATILKKEDITIITIDIDEKLSPMILGDVRNLPLNSNEFDVVTCFEVLEHLPYSDFLKALKEINRVSSSYVVISMPDREHFIRFSFKLRYFELKKLFTPPFQKTEEHEFDGQHYWEINTKGYPLERIKKDINKAGFKIKKTFRPFEYPFHRFFVLEK